MIRDISDMRIDTLSVSPHEGQPNYVTCPTCGGSGKCPACGGKGCSKCNDGGECWMCRGSRQIPAR
jgi:hypothetical protein